MNEKNEKFIKICSYKKSFTSQEIEALLTELIGAHIFSGKSELIDFLLRDDLQGFKKLVITMNQVGSKIKEILNNQ